MSSEPPPAPGEPGWSRPAPEQPPFDPNAYPPPPHPDYPGYPGHPPNGQPGNGQPGNGQHAWRTPYGRGTTPYGPPRTPYDPRNPRGPGGQSGPGGPGGPFGRGPAGGPFGRGPGGARRTVRPAGARRTVRPAGARRTVRPGGQMSIVWVIVVVAVVAILVRSRRLTSNEVIAFCVLIPSVILHEVAHGVVALGFGDDTAKRAGRITLNPFRHVTVVGTIIVPIITVIAGLGWFGWAKPVPVDVGKLRHPRNESVLVALAGPFTNLVLAAIFGLLYRALAIGYPFGLGARVLFYCGFINLWVACFNLIPIPPLDGSALVERVIPRSWWPGYLRFRTYGMVIVFGALVLFSFSRTSPLQSVVTHLATWWAHLVHA